MVRQPQIVVFLNPELIINASTVCKYRVNIQICFAFGRAWSRRSIVR